MEEEEDENASPESDKESKEEDDREPGPSVPKKRKVQESVSKIINEKDRY